MTRVSYHVERNDGAVLSLKFANPDRSQIEEVRTGLREQSESGAEFLSEVKTIETDDDELHLLYTSELFRRNFPDAGDIGLPPDDLLVVDTMLDVFRGVESELLNRRGEFKWYKRPDLRALAEAINQTE